MSIVATLILVQQYITRYVLSTILAFGTLGNLITIGIFSRKKYRKNSCSIYFIAASCFGLISAYWAIVPLVYALDHFDVVDSSLILCRIRGYIIHVSSMCFRYTLVLVCLDRYALCNSRVSIRALCRPQIAYRLMGILATFWIVVSIHLLIWESIENNRCGVYGLYGEIFSFYTLVFTGTIPISIMISVSILLMNNLRQLRFRVQPLNNIRQLNRRDIKLMKLVLVEVVVYIFCTFTYPLMTIYMTTTNNIILNKTAERKQIESFINFITMSVLLYLNYNTTFYVHFLTSSQYRAEVKQMILKMIANWTDMEPNQAIGRQASNQTRTRQLKQLISRV